jgi:hypothetical protein
MRLVRGKGKRVSTNFKILKWSLLAGALYFFSVSVVHMLGIKVPVLFIYFNVPSYAYQDRIISFLAFGWSVFLFTAFTDPQKNSALVKAILVAGAGALIGVSIINAATPPSTRGSSGWKRRDCSFTGFGWWSFIFGQNKFKP